MRGATRQKWESDLDNKFQSTRPMRGATRDSFNRQVRVGISIHAPHAGRDILAYNKSIKRGISIHAPHAGRDLASLGAMFHSDTDFNPRAPCGARLMQAQARTAQVPFQSTRPMRGATSDTGAIRSETAISIHAPHAGRDGLFFLLLLCFFKFQSTRPMRGATWACIWPSMAASFQSTRPMRGATISTVPLRALRVFQSTRPMRGATAKVNKLLCTFL